MTYDEIKKKIKASPCTRFALLRAISDFDQADPVDALRDAETLYNLMKFRGREMGFVPSSDRRGYSIGEYFTSDGAR